MKRPALFTAELLRHLAAQHGITLPEAQVKMASGARTLIYRHQSRPLAFVGEAVLDFSSNLLADTLLLHIGKRLSGDAVSLSESASLLEGYIKKQLPFINWQGFVLKNGSGLTAENRFSPAQMIAVLLWAQQKEINGRSYRTLLPIAGTKGSLTNRLYREDTAYRVFAKTGAISYGVALAGFILGKDGKEYVFAQFFHELEKRKFISDYDNKASAQLRRRAPSWGFSHRARFDVQLKKWLNKELNSVGQRNQLENVEQKQSALTTQQEQDKQSKPH